MAPMICAGMLVMHSLPCPAPTRRWDIRTKEGAVQTLDYDSGRQYAKPPKFTCIATTGQTRSMHAACMHAAVPLSMGL